MSKFLFKNANIYKADKTPLFKGDLIVDGNRITYVGESKEHNCDFDRIIDCTNYLLCPGFKNCHAHGGMTFVRNASDDLNLQDWLFKLIIPMENTLKPEDIYYLTKLALVESISSGITFTFEHYYYPHKIEEAINDIGMRGYVMLPLDSNFRDEKRPIEETFQSPIYGRIKYVCGCHSEYTPGDEIFDRLENVIHKYHLPFYTHCSETEFEVEGCKTRRNGMTPVEYFVSRGFFDYGGAIFHGIYLSEHDLELLKKYNVSVISCPSSNSKLASGICDLINLNEHGVNVALGTDGPASNNSIDMFKEMYLASVLQKLLHKDPVALSADKVFDMSLFNGAKALGLDECDSLNVGKLADLILINLKAPNLQPTHNVIKSLVYSGNKANVYMTMIDGKILYENNTFYIDEDVDHIISEANRITQDILKR